MNRIFGHSIGEYLAHGFLLLLTFITLSFAGVFWLNKDPLELTNLSSGFEYASLVIFVLGTHEMGHYITARIHGVSATLPFFIPFPSFLGFLSFGTLGAVIRVKSIIQDRRTLLDIGAAGPVAGFVASFLLLAVGFRTLPPISFLYSIHPEYSSLTAIPDEGLRFGGTLLYSAMVKLFAPGGAFVPPMNEMYHYPLLCVGWFGCFVTAMNLIPIGQLDGGHIVTAVIGVRSLIVARFAALTLVVLGIAGLLPLFGLRQNFGWAGWLFWAAVLLIFTKGLKPPTYTVEQSTPLGRVRIGVALACGLILLGTFPVVPFSM
jgi:membrane-associated protease RseP (regulator of RpoE activity)